VKEEDGFAALSAAASWSKIIRTRTTPQPSGKAIWNCLSRLEKAGSQGTAYRWQVRSRFVSTASGDIDESVPGCCTASSVSETLDWMPSGRSLLLCADRLRRTALPTPCTVRSTAHLGKLQNIVCLADHFFDSLRCLLDLSEYWLNDEFSCCKHRRCRPNPLRPSMRLEANNRTSFCSLVRSQISSLPWE
jgi:hypothetical protein